MVADCGLGTRKATSSDANQAAAGVGHRLSFGATVPAGNRAAPPSWFALASALMPLVRTRPSARRGGESMVTPRLRLLSLLTAAVVIFGACSNAASSGSAAPGGSGAAASDCAGTGAQAGANLQIPEVEAGKFNVAMVLIGPHDDGGWSQAHY